MASTYSQAHPPRILEVYREYLEPDAAQAIHQIEIDSAQICIRLKFPHRYLVLESLTAPKEYWYLNAFESQAEMDQVGRDYEGNKALASALAQNLKRKAPYLAAESTNVFLNYRPELSAGIPWVMGHGRFLVIAWTTGRAGGRGTVFEGPDGKRLEIRPVRTRTEAESAAIAAGADSRAFAIHPELGWPEDEWVAADPDFWRIRQR